MDMTMLAPLVVREVVGYLPQEARLFSGTLRDNLLLGLPDPGDESILDAARKSGLIELISGQPKGLGLEITEGGRGVSGGQKQLIALTRLLLAKPKVWLLDEPTGSMDADSEARVVALLKSQLGSQESALIATHKTALLPMLSRLLVVQNGRIVMDGPRDEVMAKLAGRG
jgi:ATP-binding cassette subfamily C protein LapB